MAHLALWTIVMVICMGTMSAVAKDGECKVMAAFADQKEIDAWRTVNDNVMGGRSSGAPRFENGIMIFSGSINTDGGGFSSVRKPLVEGAYAETRSFRIRYKGDGRRYALTFQTGDRSFGRPIAYRAEFGTGPDADWAEADIPLSAFRASAFGQPVRAPALDPARLQTLGLIISDGIDGPFALQVDWIKACRDGGA